jgi:hypothetical protein
MDATGLESTPSSAYYQTRRGQRRKGYVQVSRLVVCGNLIPCRVGIAQCPCNDEITTRNRHVHVLGQVHRVRCNDESASRNLLAKALAQVLPQQLVANAGYGAEWVHELCRERWRVNSWIPWQRLVGKAKCNHRLRLRPTRHPAGSVWSEWPSAITACGSGQPGTPLAVSGRNGRVRGRWRSQTREMPRVNSSRWHVESFISGLKRTTGSQLTAWR